MTTDLFNPKCVRQVLLLFPFVWEGKEMLELEGELPS